VRMGCFRCLRKVLVPRECCKGEQRRTFQILDRPDSLRIPV
jgi:hypothetical protein